MLENMPQWPEFREDFDLLWCARTQGLITYPVQCSVEILTSILSISRILEWNWRPIALACWIGCASWLYVYLKKMRYITLSAKIWRGAAYLKAICEVMPPACTGVGLYESVLSLEIERQCVWGWMHRFIAPVLQNFQLPSDHGLQRDTQTPAYKKNPGCNSNLRHYETFLHPKINISLLLTNLSHITYTEFHIKSTCVVTWHKMMNFQNSLDSSHTSIW